MKFETKAIHSGYQTDETLSRAVPIHRTSAYLFKNTEHAANLFALKELGNIYTRLGNPTQDVLEQRMTELENGMGALALASGTSAIFYSAINICTMNDEIVSSPNVYGGTFTMFDNILPSMGIKTKFAKSLKIEDFEVQINEKTRMIFTEVIGNPTVDVANILELSELAHKYDLPLVVDSTFTTPYIFRPIDHGADIVVHSLTKWIGGHGTSIGGIVIDSGKFNWKNKKFTLYNEPDESYHGLRYAHDLGDMNSIAFILRMRLVPLRNLGAAITPDNAWLFLQGLETLALRMQRHNDNAIQVAKYLEKHEQVNWVRYPGLKNDVSYNLAKKQFENGFGSVVVFGIKGGLKAGKSFIDNLKLISHVANVGDAKTLAIHPASTTHSQLSVQQQKKGNITPDLIRLSIGIEHIDDIIEDIENSL